MNHSEKTENKIKNNPAINNKTESVIEASLAFLPNGAFQRARLFASAGAH
jgi:hypothetical protein